MSGNFIKPFPRKGNGNFGFVGGDSDSTPIIPDNAITDNAGNPLTNNDGDILTENE
ncbi:hypothetical protein C4G95_RS18395 [Vibrio parahaemolyticus]|nr:hypothetical protein [Vibrio parahaemolyticus]